MNQKLDTLKNWLITILAVGMGVCMALTVWALFFQKAEAAVLSPDYAPSEVEANQTPVEDSGGEPMDKEEGGGAVGLGFSKEVTISLRSRKATLYFLNGSTSAMDIVLQIVVQDEVLAQSDRLTPGNQVQTLNLLSGAEKKLTAGGYDGQLVAYYYDRETGKKSNLSTAIPVTVQVTN